MISWLYVLNPLDSKGNYTATSNNWYTGRWWVGCYIWYSEEGPRQAAAPPSPLLAVPNVTAHASTASVPITVLLYDGLLLCGFSVVIKGLNFKQLCMCDGCLVTKLKASLQLDVEQFETQFRTTKPAKAGQDIVFYGFSSVKSTAAVEIAHKLGFKKYERHSCSMCIYSCATYWSYCDVTKMHHFDEVRTVYRWHKTSIYKC